MYFVCDVYDDSKYGKIMNRKELYELYVDEVANDAKANNLEYDIVDACVNELNNLAKNNLVSDKYLIDGLECYGWKLIDLLEIQRDLEDIKNYFKGKLEYYGKIDEVINIINKGVNENGRKN